MKRNSPIIKELSLYFNLYLNYIQQDLALKLYMTEYWEKNNEIEQLHKNLENQSIEINKKNLELKAKNEVIEGLFLNLREREIETKIQNMQYKPISTNKLIIDFIKRKTLIKGIQ